jgi:preprotein translocase subunit Sec63
MLAFVIVMLWFGLVAVYLVRQWWVSELAQTREGVPAPELVTLPTVVEAAPATPAFAWSTRYAASPAAR